MLLWKEAVYDRSQEDISKVTELREKGWDGMTEEEQAEWSAGLKGAFNASDMERIENNVQLLSDTLELGLTTYAGNLPTYPNQTYFDTLCKNVEKIRNAYCIHADTPKTPATPINTYQKVNDIEKILADVYEILMSNFFYCAGEGLYMGQTTALLI